MRFTPEKPNGVLYDAAGNVVFRFGGFDTDEQHTIPDFVDEFHGIDYSKTPVPGRELGKPIEAAPDRDDLPDPVKRGSEHPDERPKHDVENPQAGLFTQ